MEFGFGLGLEIGLGLGLGLGWHLGWAALAGLLELMAELGRAHLRVDHALVVGEALQGAPVRAEQLVPLLDYVAGDEGGHDDDGPEHHEEELVVVAAQVGALEGELERLDHVEADDPLPEVEEVPRLLG